MGCIHKYHGNCWTVPEGTFSAEIFEPLLQHSNVRIERIISMGKDSLDFRWYQQPWDEWVVLLQGWAVLEQGDGARLRLESGEMLWIPAHCRHRVVDVSADPPAIWLAVHIEPAGEAQ